METQDQRPSREAINLSEDEEAMLDGALHVACELAASNNLQHKNLAKILGGVCAIIVKRQSLEGNR